ncbi:PP2C family serine/threonine-protein phosphatase [Nocardioides sp. SYSU D00038]|uniref:PP2C family serine/threonine-protein phosphatase n=1 Tax=Nocardioides sp. SYSU D00038 TaxID=2812554 RepID=UPI00196833FF|nr:PP2C family serine/threonine-protein phosphatase [Nocardioides sp. SYSU D00038]
MTETPPPTAGVPCPKCGAETAPDDAFCEACGTPLGATPAPTPGTAGTAPVPAPAADEKAPFDDLGSGPISAVTAGVGTPAAPSAGRRPCLNCGGEVGPDLYCQTCGTKAPSERDHFREQPASWVAGVCDRGITHARNEDAMALMADEQPGSRAVLVVLDGVSNSVDSDVASLAGARAALGVLRTPLPQGMGTPESRLAAVTKVMTDATTAAQEAIVATTAAESTNPASATYTAAVLEGDRVVYANVGDSRIYWLPDTGDGVQLSVDDSAAQMQIAAGVPRKEAETGPQAHAITKWLGRDSQDFSPRVGERTLTDPGWLLVCSDGLWNYASEPAQLAEQIAAAGTQDPAELALRLVEFANGRGGQDNITAAVARVGAPATGQNADGAAAVPEAAPSTTAPTTTPTTTAPGAGPSEGESDG